MRRHRRDLIAPIVGVGEPAMQEDDRRAVAVDRIVDLDPVGVGLAAAVGGDRGRRRRQHLPTLGRESGQGENEKGREDEPAHGASTTKL